jgi:hypothetical protein
MGLRYRVHGLLVDSELELALPPAMDAAGQSDLALRWGDEQAIPRVEPAGSLIAHMTRPDGSLLYAMNRQRDRTVLRYPEVCDFVGDLALRDVRVHPHPGADRGLAAVLASGALLAVHLKLRPELVLHASAVQLGEGVVAFVGSSGMGKSTLAALVCAHGGRLVTDDVLRVDLADGARAYPGSTEARLRPNARPLADGAPRGTVRATADGRLAFRPGPPADAPAPLVACVVPLPSREATEVVVTRLPGASGLLRMLRFPRVVGWREPVTSAWEFQALADLVERVPVFQAFVPWGPPFAPGIVPELLEAVAATRQR